MALKGTDGRRRRSRKQDRCHFSTTSRLLSVLSRALDSTITVWCSARLFCVRELKLGNVFLQDLSLHYNWIQTKSLHFLPAPREPQCRELLINAKIMLFKEIISLIKYLYSFFLLLISLLDGDKWIYYEIKLEGIYRAIKMNWCWRSVGSLRLNLH